MITSKALLVRDAGMSRLYSDCLAQRCESGVLPRVFFFFFFFSTFQTDYYTYVPQVHYKSYALFT
jgi:hypothetical protein